MVSAEAAHASAAAEPAHLEPILKVLLAVLFLSYTLLLGSGALTTVAQSALMLPIVAIIGLDLKRNNWRSPFPAPVLALLLIVGAAVGFAFLHSFSDVTASPSVQIRFCANFILSFAAPLIGIYLIEMGYVSRTCVLKVILAAFAAYSLLKAAACAAVLLGLLDLRQIMAMSKALFSVNPMAQGLAGSLSRINLIPDVVLPYVLFAVLVSGRLGWPMRPWLKIALAALITLATIIAFSRYIIACGMLAFIAAAVVSGPRQRAVALFAALAVLVAAVSIGPIRDLVEVRLFSHATNLSDAIRLNQIDALLDKFGQAPLFGSGLATYVPYDIRSQSAPYSYELFWIAFAMQFGLLALVPLMLLAFSTLAPLVRRKPDIWSITIIALFFSWIGSGFFNPTVIGRCAGMCYLLFYVICNARGAREAAALPNAIAPGYASAGRHR